MNFGEQIKKIRKERNLTQQEMADMISVSRQAVSNWENDKNLPDIEMLIHMAQVFHLTLDELILGGSEMNNMTEKLIKDASTNSRVKMNLLGVKIGSALLGLGIVALVSGMLVPPTLEKYWGAAFAVLILCGVFTFLVVGVKNVVEALKHSNSEEKSDNKLLVIGGVFLAFGIVAYLLTITTGIISGLIGLAAIFVGIILMVVAVLTAK